MNTVRLKRAHQPAERSDGFRVLVERLWPRGIRKEALVLDAWQKELAPSTELRTWYRHDPRKWTEFVRRYRAELARHPAPELLQALADLAARGPVTLVFSTRDAEHSNAAVLREAIERLARRADAAGAST